MRRPVAPAVLLLLLLALSATQQPIAAATGGRPRTSDESDTDPNKGVHTTTTVAGVCGEGQHVTVPMVHEFDGIATVLDAELRASVNGTTDLVLLAAVDDAFAASFWGLYSASPLAKFARLTASFPGDPDGDGPSAEEAVVVECETVVKSCGDWNTLVLFRCPVPSTFLSTYHSGASTNDGAVQSFEIALESNPSRGAVIMPLCLWEQRPATTAHPTTDGGLRTAAVCVRPFRPYFFGTTTPSISPEQVLEWTSHHLVAGIDRVYLFDRYEDGRGPGKPTLENYLAPLLGEDYLPPLEARHPSAPEQRVRIAAMPYFSTSAVTFDELVTRSYIFDQAAVMEMCFMQARREGVDWVLHIDFDEYMHFSPAGGQTSLKAALQAAEGQCATEFGSTSDYTTLSIVVPRRTVVNTTFDWASPDFTSGHSYSAGGGSAAPTSVSSSANGLSSAGISGESPMGVSSAVSMSGLSASSAGQGWGEGISASSAGQGWGQPFSASSAGQGWGQPFSASSAGQGWGQPFSASSAGQGWGEGISASSAGQGWGQPFSASSAGQGWGQPFSASSAGQGWGVGISASSAGQGWGTGVSASGLSASSGGQGWGEGISASSAGQGLGSGAFGLSASSAAQGWGQGVSSGADVSGYHGPRVWATVEEYDDCDDYADYSDPSYYSYDSSSGASSPQEWGQPISNGGFSGGGISASSAGQEWGQGISASSAGQGWGEGISASSAGQGWGQPFSASSAGQGWGVGISASSAGQGWGQPFSASSAGQGWGQPFSASSAGQGWGVGISASSAGQGWGQPFSASSAGQGWGQPFSASSAGQGWGQGISASSAGQGWGEGISASSAGQGWGQGIPSAGLSGLSGEDGWGVSGTSGVGLSGVSGAGSWAGEQQKVGSRCKKPLPRAGRATKVNLNNVKTAFAVKHEALGAPFGVHHPCKPEPTDVCVAAVEALWMNHLVDAYAQRSSALKPKQPPVQPPTTPTSTVTAAPVVSRWWHILHSCGPAPIALAAAALFVAVFLTIRHRRPSPNHPQFRFSSHKAAAGSETTPLLPTATTTFSTPSPTGMAASPTGGRRGRVKRSLSSWLLLLLAAAAAVMLVSHCHIHIRAGGRQTARREDVAGVKATVDNSVPVDLDPATGSNRWLVAAPPTAAVSGQQVELTVVHSEDWDLRGWMGEWHSSYVMRLTGGPQAIVSEAVCDFKTPDWRCTATLSPCVPGAYSLQLLHYTQQPKWVFTEGAAGEDKWRKDALIATTLFNASLTVSPPPGMAAGDDPRRFPGCSTLSAAPPSLVTAGAARKIVANPSPPATDVATRPSADPTLGLWVNVDCAASTGSSLEAALCKQNAQRFSSPAGISWANFPDWGAFFNFFALGGDGKGATGGAPSSAVRGMWLPPLRSADWPGVRVPELGAALANSWMHWAGDSVTFESFAAARSLLSSTAAGDARLLCALPDPTAPSAFRPFQPCDPLLTSAAGAAKGGIDRTSEHEWLWLLEAPSSNLFLSYSWSLAPAGVKALRDHIAGAPSSLAPPLRSRMLCLGYGLSYSREFNTLMATKGGLQALSTSEQQLWAGEMHLAAQLLADKTFFDGGIVFGPTSTALDIQAWGMDLPALSHMSSQLRRWAALHGADFADGLAFSLPKAATWADSEGDYIDNVHFAGDLVWAFAEWKLNIAVRAIRRLPAQ